MKHLQTFKMFESTSSLTQDQIQFLDDCTSGSWSQDPTTGEINVEGDFLIPDNYTTDFKGLRFGKVTEYFDCSNNSLTSLEGAPTTVGGDFKCSRNSLTSLKGAPTTVGGNFGCSANSLTSLEGAPSTVEGDFFCSGNSLTSLKGAPEVIKGRFYSNDLDIPKGEWGLPEFLEILTTGTEKQKQLIQPLVDPKSLQGNIDKNPEKMAIALKPLMNNPLFQKLDLKWPGHLQSEVDLLGDLEGIGL